MRLLTRVYGTKRILNTFLLLRTDCAQEFEFKNGEVEKYVKLNINKMLEIIERITVEIHLDNDLNQYENFDASVGKRNKAVVFVRRKNSNHFKKSIL